MERPPYSDSRDILNLIARYDKSAFLEEAHRIVGFLGLAQAEFAHILLSVDELHPSAE